MCIILYVNLLQVRERNRTQNFVYENFSQAQHFSDFHYIYRKYSQIRGSPVTTDGT